MKKKTTLDFILEIREINPTINIIGEYTDSKTKIKAKCLKCGHAWDVLPASLSRGYGCPICKSNGVKPKTDEEFSAEFSYLDSDYIKIGKYIKTNISLEVECKHCHERKFIEPRYLIKNPRCNKCNGLRKRHNISETIDIISCNYDILDDFSKYQDFVNVKCKQCGEVSTKQISYLLNSNKKCRKCYAMEFAKNQRDDKNTFLIKLNQITSQIEVVGDYVDSQTKTKCKCKKCNKVWYTTPNSLLSGCGCPKCHASKGETKIETFLSQNNIYYISQKKFDGLLGIGGRSLKCDFYLPNHNLIIEYQGEFHDGLCNDFVKKRMSRTVEHDKRKKNYAKKHNINLMEIWYWDYKNIEKIITSRLKIKSA